MSLQVTGPVRGDGGPILFGGSTETDSDRRNGRQSKVRTGKRKVGQTIGRTDDLGFQIVENSIHVHDLQATILHLLGFDHTRLTYRFKGRDYRLTDVGGRVIHEILA